MPAFAPRAAFVFIYLTVVIDMLAVGVIVPVLPRLIVEFSAGDVSRGAEVTGWFGGIAAGMQLLVAPLLGALSDRFGRRPVLLFSLLGLGLDYIVMALAPSLAWLFVGRLISGATAATYPTALAYVADVTPPEQRASRYGLLASAFGLGFIVGPAVGGLLGSIDLRLPFWAAAGLCLVNASYGAFVLPESLAPERRTAFTWSRAHALGAVRFLVGSRELFRLTAVSVLAGFAHESLPNLIVLYLMARYGWSDAAVGLTVAAIGASSAVVTLGLVRRVVARCGDRRALAIGFGCATVGFLVYAAAPRGWVFLFGIPLMSAWGIGTAALQSLLSHQVPSEEQGRLQGGLNSLRGITGTLGPVFFSHVFALTVGATAPFVLPGASFTIAAGALATAAFIGARAPAARPDR